MSRFEMSVYQPEAVQFELRMVFTLEEWKRIRDCIKTQGDHFYGPAYQVREAIDDMVTKANKEYRAWPEPEALVVPKLPE